MNPAVLYALSNSWLWAVGGSAAVAVLLTSASVDRRRSWLAVGLFNVVAAAGVTIHAEWLLRTALASTVPPNLYVARDGYYTNRPLLSERFSTSEYDVRYTTNTNGYRIDELQSPWVSTQTAEWLFIGDSFTQGAQVPFADMFTSLVYKRFPDRIVVNAGISGLGIEQELNWFRAEGQQLKPDLVVLQLGAFNDFMNVAAPSVGVTERLTSLSALARLVFLADADGAALPLGRWTEPFQLSDRDNRDYNVFYNESSLRKRRDLALVRDTLSTFSRVVASTGARFIVALLPTREQVEPTALSAVLAAYGIAPNAVDMRRPNQLLRDIGREFGIEVIDLLEPFQRASPGLFFDQDVHLSRKGHVVVADAIIEALESSVGPSSPVLLGKEFAPKRYPSWSADGTAIAFQSVRDGASDIAISGPTLEGVRWLTATGADEAHPALSPDGSKLIYTKGDASTFRTHVVMADLALATTEVLTSDAGQFGAIPSFSHTGRQVAFAEWRYLESRAAFSQPRIAVRDLTTGRTAYLTSGDREAWRPVFSPTDTAVVFIERTADGSFDLRYFDLTTGTTTTLTATAFDEWDPRFSPDGDSVVYAANPDGNWDLFQLGLNTRQVTRLTRSRGDEWDPALSQDGMTVTYGGRFGSFEGILRACLDATSLLRACP